MRKLFGLIAAAALAGPLTAAAQEDGTAPAADSDVDDVIVVFGQRGLDRGMKAFLDGDYAAAEVEFEKNLRCAERQRMLSEMAYEQSYSDAVGAAAGGAPRNSGFGGGAGVFDTQQGPATYHRGASVDPDRIRERTCENSPWQRYMIAMSQLQQGKYEDAKRRFYSVIRTSREPFLFDAHYRIALLEILDGNLDEAEKRLKTLTVLQKRCRRKDDRCEFREEIDAFVAYLEPAIEKARAKADAAPS